VCAQSEIIYSALSICKVWSSKQLPRWKRRALVAAMVKRNRAAERAIRESESRPRHKPRNSHTNRGYAIEEMGRHTKEMFVRMFRLDRVSFDELIERLEPLIARDAVKAIASSGSEIPTRTRLAVILRWLAGEQHLDICFAFGVSKPRCPLAHHRGYRPTAHHRLPSRYADTIIE
jgi:hypothetical protein